MGSAQSSNVINNTMEAFTTIVNEQISSANLNATTEQVINIENVQGERINIGNITQTGNIVVNQAAVFSNLSSAKAQQELTSQLSQTAVAAMSGIPLGGGARAQNEVNQFMLAAVNMSTFMSNVCAANAGTAQRISFNNIGTTGSTAEVNIVGIAQEASINAVSDCMAQNEAFSSASQSMQTTIDQHAKATVTGFSPLEWAIAAAIVIAALIAFITIPVAVIGGTMAGVIMGVIAFICIGLGIFFLFMAGGAWRIDEMLSYGYTDFGTDGECIGDFDEWSDLFPNSTTVPTADQVARYAHAEGYVAYEYKVVQYQDRKLPIQLPEPRIRLYTSIGDCTYAINNPSREENAKGTTIVRPPVILIGSSTPTDDPGDISEMLPPRTQIGINDIWLDQRTMEWWILGTRGWGQAQTARPNGIGPIDVDEGRMVGFDPTFSEPPATASSEGYNVWLSIPEDIMKIYAWVLDDEGAWQGPFIVEQTLASTVLVCRSNGQCMNMVGFLDNRVHPIWQLVGFITLGVGVLMLIPNIIQWVRAGKGGGKGSGKQVKITVSPE